MTAVNSLRCTCHCTMLASISNGFCEPFSESGSYVFSSWSYLSANSFTSNNRITYIKPTILCSKFNTHQLEHSFMRNRFERVVAIHTVQHLLLFVVLTVRSRQLNLLWHALLKFHLRLWYDCHASLNMLQLVFGTKVLTTVVFILIDFVTLFAGTIIMDLFDFTFHLKDKLKRSPNVCFKLGCLFQFILSSTSCTSQAK